MLTSLSAPSKQYARPWKNPTSADCAARWLFTAFEKFKLIQTPLYLRVSKQKISRNRIAQLLLQWVDMWEAWVPTTVFSLIILFFPRLVFCNPSLCTHVRSCGQCVFHLPRHASDLPYNYRTRSLDCRLPRDLFWQGPKSNPTMHSLIIKNSPGQLLERTFHSLQVGAVTLGIPLGVDK